MVEKLLPTTVVGSYPQPEWLVNRDVLKSQTVPRVRVREMWRVPEEFLEQAQDDATVIAIRDMERAGIDIITDGEMRRDSARRRRYRYAGDHQEPRRRRHRCAARRRQDSPHRPGRSPRHAVPAPQH